MSKSHWGYLAGAVFWIVIYGLSADNPDRIVFLFAATFAVIHGAAEKVINHMEAQKEGALD